MTPGIHTIPASLYHADPCDSPSLSNSIIKTLLTKSPHHAWLKHPRLNPQYQPQEDSKFDLGSAAHSLLLEGYDCCQVIDAEDWRTKDAKAARDRARASGLIPMLHHQYAEAVLMVEVARNYVARSVLGNIFMDGKPEQTLVWREDMAQSSVWCRGRLDWLTTDHSMILDYKTTSVANPGAFCRTQMTAMGYDTQAAFYRRGMQAIGRVVPEFVFLIQEDSAPYSCYLVECAPSMQSLAEHKVQRSIDLWSECMETNTWPGYSDTIYHAEAAAWAVAEEESA
jgi:PDDEXK-like domain of unknown function (DUF3799)